MEDHSYFDAVEKLLENKNSNININGKIKNESNENKEFNLIINSNCYNEKIENGENNYENITEDETLILKNDSNKKYINEKKKSNMEEKIKSNDEYEKEYEKICIKKKKDGDKTSQQISSKSTKDNNNKIENNKIINALDEMNEINSSSDSNNESIIYRKKNIDYNMDENTEKTKSFENRNNEIEERKIEIKEKSKKLEKEAKKNNSDDDDNNKMGQENSIFFSQGKKKHNNNRKNKKWNHGNNSYSSSPSKENEKVGHPNGEEDEEYENIKEKEKKKKKYSNYEHSSSSKIDDDDDDSSSEETHKRKRKRSRNYTEHEKKTLKDYSSSSESSLSNQEDFHNKRRSSLSDSEIYSSDDERYYRSRNSKRRKYDKHDKLKRKDREKERREKERERIRERIRREREREKIRREKEIEYEREKERVKREKKREERRLKEEMEEAKRDDLTVLVLNLSLTAGERDIYEFFSEVAGKVRDIQCIKDQRSGKSKGVAYVEFYTQESVIKALAANGYMLKNKPIKIQSSQAEKNRAAKAAKHQPIDPNDIPLKLYIGGLLGPLSNISEQELKQLFNPFGEILDVEIHRDPYTGKSKGFGFIQFHKASEAIEAMTVMNGMEVAGREIKVGYAQDSKYLLACDNTQESILQKQQIIKSAKNEYVEQDNERIDNDDDDGGGLIAGAGSKIALMQKLQRDSLIDNSIPSKYATGANTIVAKNSLIPINPLNNVTSNIVLTNMFSPNDNNIGSDPDFFNDIIEDVKEECKKYGNVLKMWLDTKNIDGKIYVKYYNSEESLKAFQFLNGRYFGGSLINAYFITDSIWDATCL